MPASAEWSRRLFLATGAALVPAFSQRTEPPFYACTGSYTTAERRGRGDGIHVYRVHPGTGVWTHVQHVGGLVNPSFLITAGGGRSLYSVHGDESYATSFAVDRESGRVTERNRAATGGRNGVHQAIDPGGRFLVVANYASGNVAVLPVLADGSLAEAVEVVTLKGQPGPHRVEQASSHPHQVVFDPSGRFVIVPDKGLDRIFIFRFDAATGKLTPSAQGAGPARSGSGPRHAAFHPSLPVAWVVNEIGNTIASYRWDAAEGSLHPVQILPLLPPDFTGESTGAEIAVAHGGRAVYASNRGHDSIAAWSVQPKTGLLGAAAWVPSGGKTPRYIGVDPAQRFLYAAHEQSDTILRFRMDASGHLTPSGEAAGTGSPVTIAFF